MSKLSRRINLAAYPKSKRLWMDTIYSIIETAKANGLEPYQYLRYLLDQLPGAKNTDEVRALFPYRILQKNLTSIAK